MNVFIWNAVTSSPEMKVLFGGEVKVYEAEGDGSSAPYIVWSNITETPSYGIGTSALSTKRRIQFDVYAKSGRLVREIGDCLESIFLGKGIAVLKMGPFMERGTKLYRRTIDMNFIIRGN